MNESVDLSIQINGSNFTTGLYNSDNPAYWTLLENLKGTNNLQHFDITDAPGKTPSLYQVNITSITPTELQGTFSGNYVYNYFGDGSRADTGNN